MSSAKRTAVWVSQHGLEIAQEAVEGRVGDEHGIGVRRFGHTRIYQRSRKKLEKIECENAHGPVPAGSRRFLPQSKDLPKLRFFNFGIAVSSPGMAMADFHTGHLSKR
jgi:hypothetical protein